MEVVLVEDEDEDEEENEEIYDELMSIYSKYRNDSWLFRNNSTTSSTASFSSRSSSTLRQNNEVYHLQFKPQNILEILILKDQQQNRWLLLLLLLWLDINQKEFCHQLKHLH